MRTSADLLEQSSEIELGAPCQLIVRSSIPLVIVKLKNGISVDIQFPVWQDFQAIRNTNLIRHYVMADKRFGELYLWAKQLFTVLGARNSKQGLLSSYHIILLVVHFLQCKHIFAEPVLPVLMETHHDRVAPDLPVQEVVELMQKPLEDQLEGWKSENEMSTGLLALKFIEYYSRFRPQDYSIDIGKGSVFKRRQTGFNDHHLRIYDPYSPVTVCRNRLILPALMSAVTTTSNAMQNGRMIDTYPNFEDRFAKSE
ncbi:hypothetical protein L596_012041 [Steinernema carpocapsae]|uniref:PAP-associated domain-containing protein n=1 Tax=Steinernema carpocapsae TaxID=34508 RepID=A0A4U5NVX0_STECR|nr:hypothetical protein L596_012041 [Steinernema carpocapsae]